MSEVGTGASITFQSGFFTDHVLSISVSLSRPPIRATHMGSTPGEEFVPGKLYQGTMTVQALYEGEDVPLGGSKVAESITVTLGDATTWVFNGFMIDAQVDIPLEDDQTANYTIQVTAGNTGIA